MFREIEILSPAECTEVVSRIHQLKRNWIRREMMAPFYTLGAASYMDAVEDAEQNYYAVAKTTNEILWKHFQQLYHSVVRSLTASFDSSVSFMDRFALPGFHIFQGHQFFTKEIMSVHFDLQYELLEWERVIENYNPISFTLPLVLPQEGAGLWLWDLMYDEVKGKSQVEKDQLIASRNKRYHAYKTGTMLIHSGQELHQIAAMRSFQPHEERVTFQGHGLSVEGVWYIYW
jgi:hypothetical protein